MKWTIECWTCGLQSTIIFLSFSPAYLMVTYEQVFPSCMQKVTVVRYLTTSSNEFVIVVSLAAFKARVLPTNNTIAGFDRLLRNSASKFDDSIIGI